MDAQELKKYLADNEIDVQSARAGFGAADWVFRAYSESVKITGIDHNHIHCYFGPGADVFYQLISRDDIKKSSQKIYEDYLENPDSLKNKIGSQRGLMEEMERLGLEYSGRPGAEMPDIEFLGYFKRIIDLGYEWWQYAVIGEDKAEVVDWEVVPRFQKRHGINYEEAREAVSILAHPDEMAAFNQEHKKFLGICLAVCEEMEADGKNDFALAWKNEKIQGLVGEYLAEFFWMRTNFYETVRITPEMLMDDVRKEIETKSKDGIREEIGNIDSNFARIRDKKREMRDTYVLSEEDRIDIEFSQAVIAWFDQRKSDMMRQFYYIYAMMQEISARKKIDYHTCTLYFMEELFDLLEKNKQVDPAIIAKRENGVFLAFEQGQRIVYSGAEAEEMFDLIMKNNRRDVLRGVVASRGGQEKIRGTVNIVIRPDKNDFQEGKILVTSMTRVEFVPLMKKARAIITNEGGLACHAAIVSRELGLPAIISTKNATQVLQDGDEIEMDLKTGEIKVITAISAA
ncbi:MAG: PEP-utilizing enzyme [Candidatus Moranbacteria bacterium]|nr:PEP-utilizing enzyme [Candidatus Moranbacteria bacterium]